MRDGNFLDLILKLSPAGLIHKTVCKLERMLDMKNDHSDYGLSTFLAFIANGLIRFIISSISYFFLNKFGTSPVLSMLLILYRKSYEII